MPYVVITENDESPWHDQTGAVYHFPKRYQSLLQVGTPVVYYKGKMLKPQYAAQRKSRLPHYFATATIGHVYADPASSKGDLFALIEDYVEFDKAVLAKVDDQYLETIPETRKSNYWRDGVRAISASDYDAIVKFFPPLIREEPVSPVKPEGELDSLESLEEGKPGFKYTTVYERNPKLRAQAIALHGTTCKGCTFNFEEAYGELGKGFIHIHHIKPLGVMAQEHKVDPETDLVPLCANCHAMVHRDKSRTLHVDELKNMIETAKAAAI
ncbi:HNH endonuclease [Aeromonas allosaccharophila]|jgi:putative restriction endonuclease|uniref:HNH endonuclease n=1 Tax=Aeromonas allosaccharophila TaxID=656 RepID=UPI000DCFA8B0|nr:HNH endonuclease [Aeromonas allosaccharophila]